MNLRRSYCACVILMTFGSVMLPQVAWAANILWDGTGTSWNTTTTWSLFSNATTPNPAAKPGASDTAIFNIETVNTSQTVNLNAAQAALGLSFNSTGPVSIQTGAGTNTLTLGSGGIEVGAGAGANTITSALSLSASQSWINNSANSLNINGGISTAGNDLTIDGSGNTNINGSIGLGFIQLTKNGAGTLALNAANQFSGEVIINAGTVSLGSSGVLQSFPGTDVIFGAGSTGTFSLNGYSVQFNKLSTNAVLGSPVVQNGSSTHATLDIGISSSPFTFAGVLRDGAGGGKLNLRVLGPLTLSGNNLYTGLTEISNSLTLESATALGSTAGGTKLTGGEIDLRGLSIGTEELTVQSGTMRNTSLLPATWAGNVVADSVGAGNLSVLGIGDITLSGGMIGGINDLNLMKSGPNTLELSGTVNNAATSLQVNDGMVRLAKTSSGNVHAVAYQTFIEGGTVQLAGTGDDQIVGSVTVTTGSFDSNGRDEEFSSLTLNGSGIGGMGALVNSASGNSTLTMPDPFSDGAIHIGSFTRIGVTQSSASLTLNANFTPSNRDYQKVGLGTLVLNGSAQGYSGDVFLSAGTIAVGNNAALGIAQLVFGGGTLRSEGLPRTISNAVSLSSPGTIVGDVNLTLSGQITGTNGLTKEGLSTLKLTAANSYAGLTTVNGGTLAVDGSIPGSVEVNNGATLAGIGTVGGSVTLNAGSTVAPGASPESLSVGSLTMMPGSMIAMEIGGTTPVSGYDQLLTSNSLAFDGTLEVSLINGFSPSVGASFNLFDGTISGMFDTLNLQPLGTGLSWNTSQLYTTGVLSVAAGQPGDFDFDGDVDGRDFLAWQRGESPAPFSAGDLATWQAEYNGGLLVAASVAVPEPGCSLLAMLAVTLLGYRRR